MMSNINKSREILEAFSTGSSKVLDYISDDQYIQHNLSFPDGKSALLGYFGDEATGIDITIHRVLNDNDVVVVHSTYGGVWNDGQPQVAIDVFRFQQRLGRSRPPKCRTAVLPRQESRGPGVRTRWSSPPGVRLLLDFGS